jgi:replicative DNA helicase
MRDIGSCPRLYISTECKFPAIVARIRQMHAAKPLDVVYIDYLQLIEEKMAKGETRDMMIGRITRQLKNLAMELNIVIVILSQLNRAQERENNREPMLSDLRESGNIEQDADRVIFIHWPDTNPLTKNPQKPDDDTVSMVYADLMQKKGRNVGVHYLGMNFHKTAARFLEIDRSTQPQS